MTGRAPAAYAERYDSAMARLLPNRMPPRRRLHLGGYEAPSGRPVYGRHPHRTEALSAVEQMRELLDHPMRRHEPLTASELSLLRSAQATLGQAISRAGG